MSTSLTEQHATYGQPTYEADYLQVLGEGTRVIRNDDAIPVYVDGFESSHGVWSRRSSRTRDSTNTLFT